MVCTPVKQIHNEPSQWVQSIGSPLQSHFLRDIAEWTTSLYSFWGLECPKITMNQKRIPFSLCFLKCSLYFFSWYSTTLAFFPPQENALCKVFLSTTLCLVIILCIGLKAIWVCSYLFAPHKNTLVQANLGYIAGSVPDHCNKKNTAKEPHKFFIFPVHIKVITLYCSL